MPGSQHPYSENAVPVPGYRLLVPLGAGAIGQVWKAAAPGGKEVAFKIIPLSHNTAVGELESLRLLQRVSHSNLISIHALWLKNRHGDLIEDSDLAWVAAVTEIRADIRRRKADKGARDQHPAAELLLAMDLGSSTLLRRRDECRRENLPGIPLEELLPYCQDAARGLDHLNSPIHDLGHGLVSISHGDVKPDNIVIRSKTAAICDFGLAGAIENLTASTNLRGSCAYMSPEVWNKGCHRNSDQYSLAITYVELRTGELPFGKVTSLDQMREIHMRGQLQLGDLTPSEQEIIRRATSLDPEDRWRSCSKMIRELRASFPSSIFETMPFPQKKKPRREPGEGLLAAAAPAAVVAVPDAAPLVDRQMTDTANRNDLTLTSNPFGKKGDNSRAESAASWWTFRRVRDLVITVAALVVLVWIIATLYHRRPDAKPDAVAPETVSPNSPLPASFAALDAALHRFAYSEAIAAWEKLAPEDRERGRQMLKEPVERRLDDLSAVDNFVEARKLADPYGATLDKDGRKNLDQKMRNAAFLHAHENFRADKLVAAKTLCERWLALPSYGQDWAFRLLRARVYYGLGDYDKVAVDLPSAVAAAAISPECVRMRSTLEILTAAARPGADLKALIAAAQALPSKASGDSKYSFWELTPREADALTRLKSGDNLRNP